jgi:hypothetical protein
VEIYNGSEAIIRTSAGNVILLEPSELARDGRGNDRNKRDDDELLRHAQATVATWGTASGIPSLTQVQELFYKSISAGASA